VLSGTLDYDNGIEIKILGLTDICAVNETEEIQQCHRRHDAEINLPPKPRFGFGIEMNERVAVTTHVSIRKVMSNQERPTYL
jgi:hypothetical protein